MDENGNFIHDAIERSKNRDTELFSIYVDLARAPDSEIIERIETVEGEVSYVCKYIDTVCMRNVSYPVIERLISMDEIVFIEKQPYLTVSLDTSSRGLRARPSDDYSPKTAWEFGYRGNEVVVAVLDTGVDDGHEALRNKFVAGYDCSGNYGINWATNPDDKNGHGTHCAGVIMGTGDPDADESERQYMGVAPDAKLVDVKILSDLGGNLGDHLVNGMEWCIDNRERLGIDILSISVGDRSGGDDGTNANARTANAAVDAGLVVVAAAGNDGPDNDGFSSVAAADKVITVGAVTDRETVARNDDDIADYSNRGPRASDGDHNELEELKPDVVAPGTDIMSCLYSARPIGILTGYQEMTGTSMACPHIAGVAALMLEAKPTLNASQIKNIIRSTAERMGTPYDETLSIQYSGEYGFGLADAYGALKETLSDYQTVTITSVGNDDFIGGRYTLEGTASNDDPGAIQYVEVRIDEGEWERAVGTYSWSYEFDTLGYGNGDHSLFARCHNGRNLSDEDRVKVIFNNVRLEVLNHKDNELVFGEVVHINGRIIGIEVESIEITVGGVSGFRANITRDGSLYLWEFQWKTEGFPDNTYNFTFTPGGGNVFGTSNNLVLRLKREDDDEGRGAVPFPGILHIVLAVSIVAITGRVRRGRPGCRYPFRRRGVSHRYLRMES